MAYQVLARKWRPRSFSQMVGQEHVVKALTHALERDRTHHAYLFTGTRGVGKTSLARILAKALNCENRQTSDPCDACPSCTEINEGRFIDLIEVDAASRTKVEDTRDLLENVQYAPSRGRYKIYLIDEVHMLSGHSFNALLKTLEEPPQHVKFLLATTDPQKIPITVLSRCLQFNLKRMSPEQISGQLAYVLDQENITYQQEALRALAWAADGSMRDGLSLLDQAIAHGAGEVKTEAVHAMLGSVPREPIFSLLRALADNDGPAILTQIAALDEHAVDFADVLQQLLLMLHHIALARHWPDTLRNDEHAETLLQLAARLAPEEVQLYYQIGLLCRRDMPYAPDPRSGFEMAVLRMLAFRPATEQQQAASPLSHRERVGVREVNSHDQFLPPHPSLLTKPELFCEDAAALPLTQPNISAPVQPDQPDWQQMIQNMGLVGMTQQLAANCVLQSVSETVCTLVLDPGHKQLRTEKVESNLLKALQSYFSRPIKLLIKETGSVQQETPAVNLARAKAEQQRAAEQEIEGDSTVATFKELFDAQIVPGSIQPI